MVIFQRVFSAIVAVTLTFSSSAAEPLPEIPLYAGPAPGTENARQQEVEFTMFGEPRVRNVTRPTLTVYRPDTAKANGTAVVVAPGGGFQFLSVKSEGTDVAKWLADQGVTAFLLKYRLNESTADTAAFEAHLRQLIKGEVKQDPLNTPAAAWATADALAAIKLIRTQAMTFNVDPKRLGLIGFSAGGRVASGVATGYDPASRPDFIAIIYGAMAAGQTVPADAPPAFIVVAGDDPLLSHASIPMYEAWRAAKRPAELHIYQSGGHGFGMNRQSTTSDHWIDAFGWWLEALGLLKPPKAR